MTYRLDPFIEKIESPVKIVFPDDRVCEYENGSEAGNSAFDKRYNVTSIKAVGDMVEIALIEIEPANMNWTGEEPNLFDGA